MGDYPGADRSAEGYLDEVGGGTGEVGGGGAASAALRQKVDMAPYHVLIGTAGIILVALRLGTLTGEQLVMAAFGSVVHLVMSTLNVILPQGINALPGYPVVIALLMVGGPEVAALSTVPSMIRIKFRFKRPWLKAYFNVGQLALTAYAGDLAFRLAGGTVGNAHLPYVFLPAAVCIVVYHTVNTILWVPVSVVRRGRSLPKAIFLVWANNLRHTIPVYYIFGVTLSVLYVSEGLWGALLFAFALLLLFKYFKLQVDLAAAREQASTDELTHLPNVRMFRKALGQAIAGIGTSYGQVSVLLIDIDDFKGINDTYGHLAGNKVLTMVSRAIRSSIRSGDIGARWGGEEFGVILTGAGIAEAREVAERIRRAVEASEAIHEGKSIRATVSIGVAATDRKDMEPETLVKQADEAMNLAKGAGKNAVWVYGACRKESIMRNEWRLATMDKPRPSVYERAVELHKRVRGKIDVISKVPVENEEHLSLAYSPGVAEPSREIHRNPEAAYELTGRGNTIAVVSDGSAVLGLGNVGPYAALPVMEGKCVLFKMFGGVNAFPICLATQDVDEIVRTVRLLEPTFAGINLEDIGAPRCFEIEERLKAETGMIIFHDDQHGTAVVTMAGLINALKLVGKRIEDVTVVINGAGAAGVSIAKLLKAAGAGDIVVCDRRGIVTKERKGAGEFEKDAGKRWIADNTNLRGILGTLADAVRGADVFIGVSAAGVMSQDMVRSMAKDPIVFALANPEPEIMPEEALAAGAKVVATGRSDYPNQVNNVLAFPGIFRGALDVRARDITDDMKFAAARAIAALVSDEELRPDYIIPKPFDPRVAPSVAAGVARSAIESGIARLSVRPEDVAKRTEMLVAEAKQAARG